MSQWVQHKSGQGEKWEVLGESRSRWEVKCEPDMGLTHYCLPKSEYVLVEPPERWVDVTENCHDILPSASIPEMFEGGIADKDHSVLFQRNTIHGAPYRLRKVKAEELLPNQWAFLVEKKVQP